MGAHPLLCKRRVFVSGSDDKSLIIWSKQPESYIYSHRHLTGHKSKIKGIIRINNREIISGGWNGDLNIWNIDQGRCIRYIFCVSNILTQMKQYMERDIVVNYYDEINIWGAANNWGSSIKQFSDGCDGYSIESGDLLLKGGSNSS